MPAGASQTFSFRTQVPRPVRGLVKNVVEAYGEGTSERRVLPDFVIVGAQRAGTTALYQALTEHPSIAGATTKEVHYVDLQFDKGIGWYRGHFPTERRMRMLRDRTGAAVTGEASPYYLFHPLAASRLAAIVPDVRVIVMLRDPVARAVSHYHHEISLGFEHRSLTEALEQEPSVIERESHRIVRNPSYQSFEHQHHSFFSRGLYAAQLERWQAHVPANQLLVVQSERLFGDPADQLDRILEFLDVAPQRRDRLPIVHARSYPPTPPEIVETLRARYAPHDARLAAMVQTSHPDPIRLECDGPRRRRLNLARSTATRGS
jgi:Sulfotransferase domain